MVPLPLRVHKLPPIQKILLERDQDNFFLGKEHVDHVDCNLDPYQFNPLKM